MTENMITKFAPYPKTETEATAQNVYRYLLISAQVSYLRWQAMDKPRHDTAPTDPTYRLVMDAYMAAVELFVSHWSTLHLMRHAMGYGVPGVVSGMSTPDEVARDMWIGWEDGGGPAEVLWDWLVDAGFAPEEIETEFEKVANTP